jgi:hypothetical protein
MAHNWNHGNLTFGNIDIIAMVNFPSGYALHLTTQEMVTVASYIGKISTDKKYSMSISNSDTIHRGPPVYVHLQDTRKIFILH